MAYDNHGGSPDGTSHQSARGMATQVPQDTIDAQVSGRRQSKIMRGVSAVVLPLYAASMIGCADLKDYAKNNMAIRVGPVVVYDPKAEEKEQTYRLPEGAKALNGEEDNRNIFQKGYDWCAQDGYHVAGCILGAVAVTVGIAAAAGAFSGSTSSTPTPVLAGGGGG